MTKSRTRMIDVSEKPIVQRMARATGSLRLQPATLRAILAGQVEKGPVLDVARIAGVQAAKSTPDLLPLTHPIPLSGVEVEITAGRSSVTATATVQAEWKTGVEMESLVAVTVALLTVWDLVKPLEKDARGQYPHARIEGIRVVRKVKGP
jgi:cyclic pyranopterin phosphate synthase